MIPFQRAYKLDAARPYLDAVLQSGSTEGDGPMTLTCSSRLSTVFAVEDVLLMTSGTHALEAAVQALQLCPGDEVIVPSFSYPSAANAVLLAGGTVVLAEVEPDHLTLDPARLARHLTSRTRAVIVVHYGGVCCDLAPIMDLARTAHFQVIEDCAQSFLSTYAGQLTGTIGDFGCFSFHGTKDVVAGEGGALIVSHPDSQAAARRFRQKGTNRDDFSRGRVRFYEWVSPGSSYAPSELAMAVLLSQLELSGEILRRKQALHARYVSHFSELKAQNNFPVQLESTSTLPQTGVANGHLFYLIFHSAEMAAALILDLSAQGIEARTHFVPLHESRFGCQFIRPGNDFSFESGLGQRLVRLPLYASMTESEQDQVLAAVDRFFAPVGQA